MKWNFDDLESKLSSISDISKKEDKKIKQIIQNIADKDDTKQSYDFLSQEEKEYRIINDAYKKYISQYSQSYIEMSEFYHGPELPYDIYLKEFKKGKDNQNIGTYLDTPEDVKELYKLFMFYGMLEVYLGKINN
jgi:hypothetical protein